jgi:hypothetical protein
VGLPERLLLDRDRLLHQRLRARQVAPVDVELREVPQRHPDGRLCGPGGPPDRERAQVRLLGLDVFAQHQPHPGDVVEHDGHARVVRPGEVLRDLERARVERRRPRDLAQVHVERRQAVQRGRDLLPVVDPGLLLLDREGAQEERLGAAVLALAPVQDREVRERGGDQRALDAERLLADRERAEEERLGARVVALRAAELGDPGERRGEVRIVGHEQPLPDRERALGARRRGGVLAVPVHRVEVRQEALRLDQLLDLGAAEPPQRGRLRRRGRRAPERDRQEPRRQGPEARGRRAGQARSMVPHGAPSGSGRGSARW